MILKPINIKAANVCILLCGLTAILLALLVMFGWHSGNQALVQVNPGFAPMQYNTALGFLLCGCGLIFLFLKFTLISRLLGAVVFGLGAATLYQYFVHVDLGIDNFLMDPVFLTKTSHPGRPSPMTAFCFTICGFGLSFVGTKRALVMSVSLCVLVLAFTALAGYLIPQEGLYGWGNLTRMAIHTASGFVIIGTGIAVYSVWGWGRRTFDFWEMAPFSMAVVVSVLTLFSWYAIEEEGRARNDAYFNDLVADTQDMLMDRYVLYEQSLRGGLGLYYASKSVERKEWRKYVKALEVEEHLSGINGIGYIDYVLAQNLDDYIERVRADDARNFKSRPDTFYPDKFIIKFIEPVENNIEAVGLDIGFEANRRAAAERARDLGVPALTKKILLVQDHQKEAGFLLLIPVYDTNDTPPSIEERREAFQGWVYAPFIGSNFFDGIEKINKDQLDFAVYDGKKINPEALIYSNSENPVTSSRAETQLKIAGRTWTILWQPNENYAPPASENLGLVLLIDGLGFSVMLYFAFGRLLHSKEIIRQKVKEAIQFQNLIKDSIPDFMFVKDSKFRIVEANSAFMSLYPVYEQGTIIGRTGLEDHDPEEAKEFLEYDKIAFEKGYSETEETITFPDGRIRTLFTKKVRFENTKGEAFVLGIARDITNKKEAEGKIIAANNELARSNHELERFAYIASHDLQEPLRKIGGFIERLELHFADQLQSDVKAQQYMTFVVGGVVRMRELILGLLEYSRVTTTEDKVQKLDANEIVASAVDTLSDTIDENDAQVFYENLPQVYYDKVMLTQLFQNLIGNSIKYRSDKPPEIHIKAKENEGFWEFSVQDNGMGMEEKYLERIFEMFQRLHRKEEISGTGIGLSLCQKIVERYGGKIWVASEEGKGSQFYFTILKDR
ncbi:MAG: CHASE domain-containing protein [Micavibrio sp.]|nr:CHASE domain-containing protein [Micavibrio sp.]